MAHHGNTTLTARALAEQARAGFICDSVLYKTEKRHSNKSNASHSFGRSVRLWVWSRLGQFPKYKNL